MKTIPAPKTDGWEGDVMCGAVGVLLRALATTPGRCGGLAVDVVM